MGAGEGGDHSARTTQFHDFVGQLLGRMRRGRLAVVPHLRIQPVELAEVASRLLDCLDGEPASRLDRLDGEPASRLDRAQGEPAEARPVGRVPDLAGPREEDLLELARQWLAHHGDRTRVIGLRLPGRAGRAVRDGGLRSPMARCAAGRSPTGWPTSLEPDRS